MARGKAFQLSFYVTLALAMLCLALAEFFFLVWIPALLVACWIAFVFAWRAEGRWQLSEHAANTIGLVISFIMIGWIVLQIPRSEDELLTQGIPWPAGLLPYLGPLLMVLTAAKLFRPKLGPDFWVLQVLGLMMVTLASVLAGEVHHTACLFLYLVGLHWCLALHYRQRAGVGANRAAPLFAKTSSDSGRRFTGLGNACLMSGVASLIGIVIFYLAPRHPTAQWMPHRLAATSAAAAILSTGAEGELDLNHEGKVELSEEIAFELTTQDHQGRSVDLPENFYWRGEPVEYYRQGRWLSAVHTNELWPGGYDPKVELMPPQRLFPLFFPTRNPSERPEAMVDGQVYFVFRIRPALAGNLVMAEPPDPTAVGIWPQVGSGARPPRQLVELHLGTDVMVPARQQFRRHGAMYGQLFGLDSMSQPRPAGELLATYVQDFLLQPPPAELGPWTRKFILRLPGLPEDARAFDSEGRVAVTHHAKVARAITRHLSESGEYLYSLEIRRIDKKLDPIVDFLWNVKEGHCERYASALTLMLRAVGIPCRLVQGYRGSEVTEQKDHLVRFRHAHSWVEALVPSAAGKGEDWIRLDPTPSQEAPQSAWQRFVNDLQESWRQTRNTFRAAILEFGAEGQGEAFRNAGEMIVEAAKESGPYVPPIAALVGLVWLGRRFGRGLGESLDVVGRLRWMRMFLHLARRHGGLKPLPQETWHEFVARVRQAWAPRLPAELSASLDHFAMALDQYRFGGHPLPADEHAALLALVGRLRCELRK